MFPCEHIDQYVFFLSFIKLLEILKIKWKHANKRIIQHFYNDFTSFVLEIMTFYLYRLKLCLCSDFLSAKEFNQSTVFRQDNSIHKRHRQLWSNLNIDRPLRWFSVECLNAPTSHILIARGKRSITNRRTALRPGANAFS